MKKIIYITLCISVIFSSCRKPDEFTEGPDLYDVYGDFEIYSPLEGSQLNEISHLEKQYTLTVN